MRNSEFREESPPASFVDQLSARIEADALPMQPDDVVQAYRAGFATVAGIDDPDTGQMVIEVRVVTDDALLLIGRFDGELLGFRHVDGVWLWEG